MLKDLAKNYSVIHIAEKEYRVRYSLNCLLYLEVMYKPLSEILGTEWQKWSIEDVLQLVRAAMCDMHWNKKVVNRRLFDKVKPSLQQLGEQIDITDLPKLKLEIVNAIVNSMPRKNTKDKQEENPLAELQLRAFYVDIMGRPENEFFDSNYKEITDRTENYLIAKGLKKPPVVVKMLDD